MYHNSTDKKHLSQFDQRFIPYAPHHLLRSPAYVTDPQILLRVQCVCLYHQAHSKFVPNRFVLPATAAAGNRNGVHHFSIYSKFRIFEIVRDTRQHTTLAHTHTCIYTQRTHTRFMILINFIRARIYLAYKHRSTAAVRID